MTLIKLVQKSQLTVRADILPSALSPCRMLPNCYSSSAGMKSFRSQFSVFRYLSKRKMA
jgi:hypothetical protein